MVYVIYHVTYTIALCTVKNNFWNKTLHVSDSSSVHHQQFFTVHTAMVYVIQVMLTVCEQDQDGTDPARSSCFIGADFWFCNMKSTNKYQPMMRGSHSGIISVFSQTKLVTTRRSFIHIRQRCSNLVSGSLCKEIINARGTRI